MILIALDVFETIQKLLVEKWESFHVVELMVFLVLLVVE